MARKGSINLVDITGFALLIGGALIIRASSNLYAQFFGALLITAGAFLLSGRAGK